MALKTSLHDYFKDAPYFREHEGLIGARHHIKDPRDPFAGGLWIATTPERMSIATQVDSHYDHSSREAALRDYTFKDVIVQPGDGVINYYVSFPGMRRTRPADPLFWKTMYDDGAQIRFHVSKEDLSRDYYLDETGHCYRRKPFQKKIAGKDVFIELPDGVVEHVTPYSEATLQKGVVKIYRELQSPGWDERVICGQPLEFYFNEAVAILKADPGPFGGIPSTAGLFVSEDAKRNPYKTLRATFAYAGAVFQKAKFPLSSEQRGEFDAHVRDLELRYQRFEAKLRV